MSKSTAPLPDWERVLSSAARLQQILPDAVLAGGLASAQPCDLEGTDLSEYRNVAPRWHDWNTVKTACARISVAVFDRVCDAAPPHER